ncbi:hypothetical protein SJA_C1-15240 [Sphingobium indicum UT26S]|uniref:Uncharacterized protein n=1 Tax=Sphingobium indicum (strain DSM 16413 / CCM 7287 / MTCC 6362 / UT26 / NBRC 101211 / UT26S) TaxID=452662 RepID=D4Z176_SPHIU|nr:hypothetical protein SJA_C1-15240 [Sphingobium indicum UT26S]
MRNGTGASRNIRAEQGPSLSTAAVARQRGQIRKCREMANSSHQFSVTPGLTRGPAFLLSAAPRPRQRDPGSSPG